MNKNKKRIKIVFKVFIWSIFIIGALLLEAYSYLSIKGILPKPNEGAGFISLAPWYLQILMYGAFCIGIVGVLFFLIKNPIGPKGGVMNSFRYWKDGF